MMMMMMSGGMIDTNRFDGVVFPISMCVRELELRYKEKVRERNDEGREGNKREITKVVESIESPRFN